MVNSATIKSSTSPESSPVGLLDCIVIMVNSATIKPSTTSPESSPVGLLEEFCIPTTTAEKPASEEMTGIARSGKWIESMKTMLNISANSTSVEAETRDEENHDTMRGRVCDKEHPKREMRDDGAEPLKLNIVMDAVASAVESIKGDIDWWLQRNQSENNWTIEDEGIVHRATSTDVRRRTNNDSEQRRSCSSADREDFRANDGDDGDLVRDDRSQRSKSCMLLLDERVTVPNTLTRGDMSNMSSESTKSNTSKKSTKSNTVKKSNKSERSAENMASIESKGSVMSDEDDVASSAPVDLAKEKKGKLLPELLESVVVSLDKKALLGMNCNDMLGEGAAIQDSVLKSEVKNLNEFDTVDLPSASKLENAIQLSSSSSTQIKIIAEIQSDVPAQFSSIEKSPNISLFGRNSGCFKTPSLKEKLRHGTNLFSMVKTKSKAFMVNASKMSPIVKMSAKSMPSIESKGPANASKMSPIVRMSAKSIPSIESKGPANSNEEVDTSAPVDWLLKQVHMSAESADKSLAISLLVLDILREQQMQISREVSLADEYDQTLQRAQQMLRYDRPLQSDSSSHEHEQIRNECSIEIVDEEINIDFCGAGLFSGHCGIPRRSDASSY